MPAELIVQGSRVRVTGFILPEHSQIDTAYLGEKGIVTDTDGVMHTVFLDKYQEEGPLCFLGEELSLVFPTLTLEGGEDKPVYTPITPSYILGKTDLSVFEKLTYFLIHHENPATYKEIEECLGATEYFAQTVVKKLLDQGLIIRSKTHADTFFCNYQLNPSAKTTEPKQTVITEDDKDILLFIQCIEEYYHKKGANHPISKNGKKYITKAVYFLDGMWKKKKIKPELDEFEVKADFYNAFIEYALNNVPKDDLNQLKRITFSGTKRGFKSWLTKPTYRFEPHLVEKKFDNDTFYGVLKKSIPVEIEKSGYWNTYRIFLGSRWKDGGYPLAKQVLYALEMIIIFMMFRKKEINGVNSGHLIAVHGKYLTEYKRAEMSGKLDNLTEFVTKNKLNSNMCNDCTIKRGCTTYKTAAIVVNCSRKKVINGD